MFDKFNFYDFLGYLLPGAAALFLFYLVFKAAFGLPFPSLSSDLAGSVVFLGLSYVVGHLIQALGSGIEDRMDRSRDPKVHGRVRFGERLLLSNGPNTLNREHALPNDVRERIKSAADAVFGARSETEIFDLCQALIAEKSVSQRTEIYTAQRGLARGMFVTSGLGIALAALVALQQLIENNLLEAAFFLVAALALIPINLLFWRGFIRFREYFGKSVYWAFLAWYGEQTFDPRITAKTPQ